MAENNEINAILTTHKQTLVSDNALEYENGLMICYSSHDKEYYDA